MKNKEFAMRKNRKGQYLIAIAMACVTLFVGGIVAFSAYAQAQSGDRVLVITDLYSTELGITDHVSFSVPGNEEYNGYPAYIMPSNRQLKLDDPVPESGYHKGFSFAGWKGNSSNLRKKNQTYSASEFIDDGTGVMVNQVTAVWQKNYIVYYHSGIADVSDQHEYSSFKSTTDTMTIYKKNMPYEGHSLVGWSTKANPTTADIDYQVSGSTLAYGDFTELNDDETRFKIDLYAVWVDNIDVTYVWNLTGDSYKADQTESVNPWGFRTESSNVDGYSFINWTTLPDSGNSFPKAHDGVKESDLTAAADGKYYLYAHWNKDYQWRIRKVDSRDLELISGFSSDTTSSTGLGQFEQHYDASIAISYNTKIVGYGRPVVFHFNAVNGPVVTAVNLSDFTRYGSHFEALIYAVYDADEYADVQRVMQSPSNVTIKDGGQAPTGTTVLASAENPLNFKDISAAGGFGDATKFPVLQASASTFQGWKMYYNGSTSGVSATLSSDGTYYYFKPGDFDGKTNGTITIKDEWETNYRILYDPNYAESTSCKPYVDRLDINPNTNKTVGVDSNNPNTPRRVGFDWIGWSKTRYDTTVNDGNDCVGTSLPLTDFTTYDAASDRLTVSLYGQWKKKFHITCVYKDSNGGDQTKEYYFDRTVNEAGSFDAVSFSDYNSLGFSADDNYHPKDYQGYTFSHWSLTRDGAAPEKGFDLSEFTLETEEEVPLIGNRKFHQTIYAVYVPAEFDVEFKYNYGGADYAAETTNGHSGNYKEGLDEGTEIEGKPEADAIKVKYTAVSESGYVPPTLFAKGFRFDGWYYHYQKGTTNNVDTLAPGEALPGSYFTTDITTPIVFRARWTKLYRVKYVLNDNAEYPAQLFAGGTPVEYEDFETFPLTGTHGLQNMKRDTFIYRQWSKTAAEKYTGTKGVTSLPSSEFTDVAYENGGWAFQVTVWCLWEKNVTRYYYGNGHGVKRATGGSTAPDVESYTKGPNGSSFKIDKSEFNWHPDWNFAYWNTKPDGTGTIYEEGDEVQYLTEDLHLYAIWTNVDYTLTYEHVNVLNNAEIDRYVSGDKEDIVYADIYDTRGKEVTLPKAKGYVLDHVEVWSDAGTKLWQQNYDDTYRPETYKVGKNWFFQHVNLTIKFVWNRRCAIIYEQNIPREGAVITGAPPSGYAFYDESFNAEGYYTNISTTYYMCKEDEVYGQKNYQTFICKGYSKDADNVESKKVTSLPLSDFTKVEEVTYNGNTYFAHVVRLKAIWIERAVIIYHSNGGTYNVDGKSVTEDYRLPSNIYTVDIDGFPTYPSASWTGHERMGIWNTEPDGSGTYYYFSNNSYAKSNNEENHYLRSDAAGTVYLDDFRLESGQLHLYEQWVRKYTLYYHKNDPDVAYDQRITSDTFKLGVSYPGEAADVPVHEIRELAASTGKRMVNDKSYYFLGWSWTEVDHLLEEDEEIPELVSYAVLNDLRRASSGGHSGSGEGETEEDEIALARSTDTAVHFTPVAGVNNGQYEGHLYAVWSPKSYSLHYITGERKNNADSTRARAGSVVMPSSFGGVSIPETAHTEVTDTMLSVTGLSYNDLRGGMLVIPDKPTAEGYTFRNWKIYRGTLSGDDAIDYTLSPEQPGRVGGYYGLNVPSGYRLSFYVFNANNPSRTVILVPNWERKKHNIEYWIENYNLTTGEPIMDGDVIQTRRINTVSGLLFEQDIAVGENQKENEIYHPDYTQWPSGKIFGGWQLWKVDGVEVSENQVVPDAGHYDGDTLTYQNINLLQKGEHFYMPDHELTYLAIYVAPKMTVTYQPGDGYSDAARTAKVAVVDDTTDYNGASHVRYAVHDTAAGGVADCGFYPPRGYRFKEWRVNITKNRSKESYPTGEGEEITHLQHNITYTAQWEKAPFEVRYEFAYAFGEGTQPTDIVYEEAAALSEVTGANRKVLLSGSYLYGDTVTIQKVPSSYESRKGQNGEGKVYDASKYVLTPWTKIAPTDELTYTNSAQTAFSMPDELVKFRGTFSLKNYTVTYDPGTGTSDGTLTPENVVYDGDCDVKTFAETGFTPPVGQEFDHWQLLAVTDPSTTANTYPALIAAEAVSTAKIENLRDNITYQAVYRDKKYHVYYTLTDDSAEPNAELRAAGQLGAGETVYTLPSDAADYTYSTVANVIPMAEDIVEGYTFSGWSVKSPSGTVTTTEDGVLKTVTVMESDVILEGRFTRDNYTVQYHMNLAGDDAIVYEDVFLRKDVTDGYQDIDGSVVPVAVESGSEQYHEFNTAVAPHKRIPDGFTFVKWNTARDGTGSDTDIAFAPETKVYHVYAIWYDWNYELTYESDYGTLPSENPQRISFEDLSTGDPDGNAFISNRSMTQNGYEFLGWEIVGKGKTYSRADVESADKNARKLYRSLFDESNPLATSTATAQAQWNKLYRLKFDLNGGSVTPALTTVTFAKDPAVQNAALAACGVDSLPTPSMDHASFNRWVLVIGTEEYEFNGTLPLKDFAGPVEADGEYRFEATLKATWTLEGQFHVNYSIYGEHLSDYDELPTEGDHYELDVFNVKPPIDDDDVKGYHFSGWYAVDDPTTITQSTVEIRDERAYTMPGKNVTFWGRFTPKGYNVEYYDADGTSLLHTAVVPYKDTATVGWDGTTNLTPDKNGYTFLRWERMDGSAVQDASDTPVVIPATVTKAEVDGKSVSFKMPIGTVKYRAVYEQLYRLVYHTNDGTASIHNTESFAVQETNDSENPYIKSVDNSDSNKPAWTGHRFVYWSKTAADSGKAESFSVTYANTDTAQDAFVLDVYAIWEDPFPVTYRIVGDKHGQTEPTNPDQYERDTFAVKSVPTVEGYDFDGWHYDYGDTEELYHNGETFTMPNHAVEFTGEFKPIVYKLYFMSEGTEFATQTESYADFMKDKALTDNKGGIIINQPTPPSKAGFNFLGWALASDAATEDYHNGDKVLEDHFTKRDATVYEATVYAVWEAKVLTLRYDRNGGTLGYEPDPVTVSGVDSITGNAAYNNGNTAHPGDKLGMVNHRFAGWNTQADGSGEAYLENAEYTFTAAETVLYAQWTPIETVKVVYDANGGQNADGGDVKDVLPPEESGEKPYVTTVKAPSDKLVNGGFEFDGWKDGAGNAYTIWTETNNVTYTFSSDTTLYAQWKALPTPMVTYRVDNPDNDPASGTYSVPESKTYYEGQFFDVEDDLSVTGYVFSGWIYGGVRYPAGVPVRMGTENIEFVGRFTKEGQNFTVTYVSGVSENEPDYDRETLGRSHTFEAVRNADYTVRGNDDPEINFVRENYNFVGWRLSTPSGGQSGGSSAALRTLPASGAATGKGGLYILNDVIEALSGDITMTAEWEPLYKLQYDANGGSGSVPATKSYAVNTSVPVDDGSGISRSNMSFLTWNTDPDRKGTDYAPSSSVVMEHDITLYAIWTTEQTYRVYYDGNGQTSGEAPVDSKMYRAGDPVTTKNKGSLARNGCMFVEWNTKADGSGTRYDEGVMNAFTMPDDNVTLYAIWKQGKTHRVYYDGNGATSGSVPLDKREYLAGEAVSTAEKGNLARNGCTFVEWNTKPNGTGEKYQPGQADAFTMPDDNVTLYAIWKDTDGKIVYHSPGTGESGVAIQISMSAAVLALLAAFGVMLSTRRKRHAVR